MLARSHRAITTRSPPSPKAGVEALQAGLAKLSSAGSPCYRVYCGRPLTPEGPCPIGAQETECSAGASMSRDWLSPGCPHCSSCPLKSNTRNMLCPGCDQAMTLVQAIPQTEVLRKSLSSIASAASGLKRLRRGAQLRLTCPRISTIDKLRDWLPLRRSNADDTIDPKLRDPTWRRPANGPCGPPYGSAASRHHGRSLMLVA